MFSSSSLTTR